MKKVTRDASVVIYLSFGVGASFFVVMRSEGGRAGQNTSHFDSNFLCAREDFTGTVRTTGAELMPIVDR